MLQQTVDLSPMTRREWSALDTRRLSAIVIVGAVAIGIVVIAGVNGVSRWWGIAFLLPAISSIPFEVRMRRAMRAASPSDRDDRVGDIPEHWRNRGRPMVGTRAAGNPDVSS